MIRLTTGQGGLEDHLFTALVHYWQCGFPPFLTEEGRISEVIRKEEVLVDQHDILEMRKEIQYILVKNDGSSIRFLFDWTTGIKIMGIYQPCEVEKLYFKCEVPY